jgi:four helix bundle protein
MKESGSKKYDLEERTAALGEAAIDFAHLLPTGPVTTPLISQFVRSATSIGANYCEADDAESKKDFLHKIGLCKKEARETKYWLRMIAKATPTFRESCQSLWQETRELHLIFAAIIRTGRKSDGTN